MAIKTIDCVDCGASVPDGRLSCPACGALLTPVVVQAHLRGRPKVTRQRPPAPVAAQPESSAEAAHEPHAPASPAREPDPATSSAPEPEPDAAPPAPARPAFAPTDELPLGAAPAPTPWEPLREPAPVLVARPYQRHGAFESATGVAPAPLPGAYLPPAPGSAASASLDGTASVGAGRASTAQTVPAGASATASLHGVSESSRIGRQGIAAATLVEIAGWFVIVGSAMAILGFLLPWSVTVIGSSGVGGYFNSWGLASPTHLLVEIGLLVGLALGIVPNKVPTWVRSGLYGVAVGGLLLGLVWPYLVGRLGPDVGVTVTALGGLALVVGGVVASWASRHGVSDPSV